MWIELKQTGAVLLAAVNTGLLVWAANAYRRRAPMPDGYYKVLAASPVVAALQVGLGLFFLSGGMRAPVMHIFYGSVVGAGALAQIALGRRTALGHRFRARPLVHLFLALVVALVSLRAWMAA